MKKLLMTAIALMAMVALGSPLYAAGGQEKASGQKQQAGSMEQQAGSMQIQSARELMGMGITSQGGEKVGSIQDIKLDTETGRVKYVTISKGGVLGVGGERGIPVPLEAFSFTDKGATLTVDTGKLDTAPQPSGMADENFQQKLESHYGVSPAWQQESSPQKGMEKESEPQKGMMKEQMHQPEMQMQEQEMKKQQKSSPY